MPRFVITKAEVQVKPFMTKRGPRKGYQRFDPREKQEPKEMSFGLTDANPEEFVQVRTKVPKILQEYFTPFLTNTKDAGVAVKPDGDIVNLFSLEKGKGRNALLHAIMNGGRKLDCFDKKKEQEKGLPDYYKTFCFVEMKREKNWNEGEPDVVYMELPSKGMSKSVMRRKAIQMEKEDKTKKEWRQGLMKKLKGKDYTMMDQALLDMMGEEATKKDRELVQKMLKN